MSSFASTSALRLIGGSGGRCTSKIARVAIQRRDISYSLASRAEYQSKGDDTAPSRAHRRGTELDRGAGGPDLDPLSSAPRNASTATTAFAKSRGAEALADLAQNLTNSRAVASIDHFNLPATSDESDKTAPQFGFAAPSGYSTELLPLRIDPTLEAFVNNLMRDGKKASANRHIIEMMEFLSQALHADPLPAVQSAIASAGPLVRMQSRKTGGKITAVPQALNAQQSRRKGIVAIIEASRKRGDKKLSVRLAKEIISILEGNSATLQRKEEIHRLATVNRSNASVRI